jgi:hypothetical protein
VSSALIEIIGLKPAAWLGIVGGVLEITGFALVATELVRAQRRELGHAGPFQFVLNWANWVRARWARLFGKPQNVTIHVPAAEAVAAGDRLSLRLSTESDDLAERVRVLETNLRRFGTEVEEQRAELDDRIGKEVTKLEDLIVQLRVDVDAQKEKDRLAFADSAKLQWLGIFLFVFGAGFSASANVVGAS